MKYTTFVESTFTALKNDTPRELPVYQDKKHIANLKVITKTMLDSSVNIRLLTKWRLEHQDAFPSQFKVTEEGTKKWSQSQLLDLPDRILFFLETLDGKLNPLKKVVKKDIIRFVEVDEKRKNLIDIFL